jgi:hypothetical protein
VALILLVLAGGGAWMVIAGAAAQDPALEAVAHLVHLVLYGDDLAGEPCVVVEEG